jgi:hypothetical protein
MKRKSAFSGVVCPNVMPGFADANREKSVDGVPSPAMPTACQDQRARMSSVG